MLCSSGTGNVWKTTSLQLWNDFGLFHMERGKSTFDSNTSLMTTLPISESSSEVFFWLSFMLEKSLRIDYIASLDNKRIRKEKHTQRKHQNNYQEINSPVRSRARLSSHPSNSKLNTLSRKVEEEAEKIFLLKSPPDVYTKMEFKIVELSAM